MINPFNICQWPINGSKTYKTVFAEFFILILNFGLPAMTDQIKMPTQNLSFFKQYSFPDLLSKISIPKSTTKANNL